MLLSIADLSQVPPGGSIASALDSTLDLAVLAETLGYRRYWVAEHHGMGHAIGGSSPEVLVARLAAATSTLRVGSGGVLLNYAAPLRVAEAFTVLAALFPGRIDLGIGRADAVGGAHEALSPQSGASPDTGPAPAQFGGMMAAFAHEDRVTELLSWLGGASTATVPGPGPISVAGVAPGSSAEPWLLGSSPVSALLAGRLGLPYCFAAFVNPAAARLSLDAYRSTFQPRPGDAGPEAPRTMLAVNLCCADTDLEADRLRASVEQFYDEDQAPGTPRPPLLDPEAAVARLGAVPPPTPPDGGQWPRHLSGGPARAASLLERLVEETGADEVMVQDLIARPEDRRRSYELLARVMEPALLGAAPETPPRSTVGDPSQRAPAR